MLKQLSTAIVTLALLSIAACRTAPIPQPYVVPLPGALTSQQAEIAVLAGITNSPPPKGFDPTRPLSKEDFESLIWRDFVRTARGRSWFLESRDGKIIYAAVDTRGLYLRAAVRIEPNRVVLSIVESKNLSQTENRIHKRAIKWLRNLDAHIRREVGRMAAIVDYSTEQHVGADRSPAGLR